MRSRSNVHMEVDFLFRQENQTLMPVNIRSRVFFFLWLSSGFDVVLSNITTSQRSVNPQFLAGCSGGSRCFIRNTIWFFPAAECVGMRTGGSDKVLLLKPCFYHFFPDVVGKSLALLTSWLTYGRSGSISLCSYYKQLQVTVGSRHTRFCSVLQISIGDKRKMPFTTY